MSTINKNIFHAVALWFYVGIGPMIGSGLMELRQRMRSGVGRLGSAEKRQKTSHYKPTFANPHR